MTERRTLEVAFHGIHIVVPGIHYEVPAEGIIVDDNYIIQTWTVSPQGGLFLGVLPVYSITRDRSKYARRIAAGRGGTLEQVGSRAVSTGMTNAR